MSAATASAPDAGHALDAAQRQAIDECLSEIKAMIRDGGVTRPTLDAAKRRLIALGRRTDLFNSARFPIHPDDTDDHSTIWFLTEDPDHTFALFAVAETDGNLSPPHDHTTWAVLAGIEGEEVNRFYDRVDDGATPGHARIRESGHASVAPGTGIALLPDDIHSIHCRTPDVTLNFHLYGLSIQHLPGRKMFNMRDDTYKVFPAQPNIRHP